MGDSPRVIAIGGGGCSNGTDPQLDEFVTSQCATEQPVVGFVGAASDDDGEKIAGFHEGFSGLSRLTSHLSQTSSAQQARTWVARQNIIYVGGGDTLRLLEHLRESGLGELLLDAANDGTLLAGVSAGAMCWFECSLSHAGGEELGPLAGLGLLAGSCCPHYSTERDRRELYPRAVAERRLPGGVAIDDGVAVLFAAQSEPVAFSARDEAWAYSVERAGGSVEAVRLGAI